ncbi:MAG: protein kinase [Deltaproteobacteria bacterium]|nr:protein kinase [Deltaproteobacteria bacterium]MBP7289772.1 protein kinase [Nannocystaceae bacterium]
MSRELPQIFGRYVLTELLGEGGMAEVYLATVRVAEGLTKRVVIKKIRRDFATQREFMRMFVDEAKIALSLNHANIVQVFDFGQVHGTFYLAMELVEGVDLMRLFHAVRNAGEAFPPVIAAYLAHQVAAGLAYAHRKHDDYGQPLGIVHRDVSPHNIMVSYAGQVKILDFGIARTREHALGRIDGERGEAGPNASGGEETIKGKVAYMSPEQALGRAVDLRSDVYSLGIVLYELLGGKLLFRDKDRMAALDRVRTEVLPPLHEVAPHVPPELAAIVDHALARDLSLRFESARALQSDLAAFLHRADPVVDDEVLTNFVARFARHAALDAGGPGDAPSRDVDPGGTPMPRRTSREAQRVVVVYAALEPPSVAPGVPVAELSGFATLVRDIAFKRDAQVLRSDPRAAIIAFGTLLRTADDADRALRVALALREDIGEAAPGWRLGLVVANAAAVLQRSGAGPVLAELRRGVAEQLDHVARHFMEGPVMVSGNLVELLVRAWRFGDGSFVEPAAGVSGTATVVDHELEHVAPLLGPALEDERKLHQVPGGRTVLYGRELELKALRDALAEAIRSRESRAVLVLGSPGMGKRALVERFISSLPRTACWVLRAAGSWSRRNVPLGVFLELLQRFLGIEHDTPREQIAARLAEHGVADGTRLAEALASALGLKDAQDGELDPFTRRDRLWRLVRRLITALAQRRPVLVVLENIHFHDEQSVLLLREWIQLRHPWPILGISTGRPGHLRVEMIRREPNVSTVDLGELDERARRDLIVRRFEDETAAGELADAVLARTGGNPLFIEQVLASLLDRGVIGWSASGRLLTLRQRGVTIELPPSVEAALAEGIEELSRSDREVLQGAALLGRAFRPGELSDLLARNVSKSLENLLARHFLERVATQSPHAESFRFATVSLHEVCRASIAPEAAKRLHGRCAELRRARPDYAPEHDDGPIAEHLLQAERGTEAIEPAMRAAMRAYEVAGNVEAHYFLTQALRAMAADDPRRWDALLRRERILRAWGRRRAQGADVRQLLACAEQLGDPEKVVIASIRLLRFYLEVGRIAQAERLIPRLRERIAAQNEGKAAAFSAVLGELESELAFMRGEFDEAERVARDALAHCGAGPRGARQRCRLLRSIGQVANTQGRFAHARTVYGEALDIARELGNPRLEANLLNALGEVAGRSTHYQEAVDCFKAALAIDRDLGDRYLTGRKLANLGSTYAAIGLYRRAERCLRKALELHEAVGHPGEFNDVIVQLGVVMANLGDLEAARALLVDAARVAVTRGDVRIELRARVRLAYALAVHGTSDEDAANAAMIAEQVATTAQAHGLRTPRCRALHVLARLADREGRIDDAIALEREAVALVQAGAAPLDGVRSIHHLGRLLADAGETVAAQPLLAEAALLVRRRFDDLRDEDLRRGYLDQDDARQILHDGGGITLLS